MAKEVDLVPFAMLYDFNAVYVVLELVHGLTDRGVQPFREPCLIPGTFCSIETHTGVIGTGGCMCTLRLTTLLIAAWSTFQRKRSRYQPHNRQIHKPEYSVGL